MNIEKTANLIREKREEKKLTQKQLAEILAVSEKTISKWETQNGFPDITLLEPLSKALSISVIELMQGEDIKVSNKSFNMNKVKFYVCPICGNIFFSTNESIINCCGINLLPLEANENDNNLSVEKVEDEYFVSIDHEMKKEHYISFIASVNDRGVNLIKLYPEENCEAYFKIGQTKYIYYYCNKHGLFKKKIH